MSRHKKDGKRAVGIQAKDNYLYIITSYKDPTSGKKKNKWTATGLRDTKENVEKAKEYRLRILKQPIQHTENITVSEYIDEYISEKMREIADTTYSTYSYRGKRIKDYFGNTLLRKVSKKDIEAFFDYLFEEKDLTANTVKDTRRFFKSVMENAKEDGVIATNPIDEAKINKSLAALHTREKITDEAFFSHEEAMVFLDIARGHELYEFFYITLFFGLRREECLGLKWDAIDFENKQMKIFHSVTKGTRVNRYNMTKTAHSKRSFPLSSEQIDLFQRLKAKEESNRALFGDGYTDNNYVFKHPDGRLYYPDYPSRAFSKLIKKHPELPQGITLHGLRKSCVSILIQENLDIKSIQEWAGHADVNTTLKIYALVKTKDAQRNISQTMSNRIHLKAYADDD